MEGIFSFGFEAFQEVRNNVGPAVIGMRGKGAVAEKDECFQPFLSPSRYFTTRSFCHGQSAVFPNGDFLERRDREKKDANVRNKRS